MRSPERVLNSLSEHSKDASYKFERLYRILFNEEMFYVAYQRIYAKEGCLLYTSPSPRDVEESRMPSSA